MRTNSQGAWRIDILINAAGGNIPGATISPDKSVFDLNIKDFDRVSDLNYKSTVLPTLEVGRIMARQKSGSIINISSMAAMRSITRVVGYSAAKAAVSNFHPVDGHGNGHEAQWNDPC